MKVSVIMPVYNEVATIGEILARVRAAQIDRPLEQIIVVDGSSDGTHEFLKDYAIRHVDTRVVLREENRGKGACP